MFKVGDEVVINLGAIPKYNHKLYLSYFKVDKPYKVLRNFNVPELMNVSSEKNDAYATPRYFNIYDPSFAGVIRRKILSGGIKNV